MFSNTSEDSKEEPFHRSKLAGGPQGLGEPDDRTLRKLEKNVLIPERMRTKARKELCEPLNFAFANCARDSGFLMPFKCQTESNNLKDCIRKYFEDPVFEKQITEEYLAERAEYRQTGISKKKREAMEKAKEAGGSPAQSQSK